MPRGRTPSRQTAGARRPFEVEVCRSRAWAVVALLVGLGGAAGLGAAACRCDDAEQATAGSDACARACRGLLSSCSGPRHDASRPAAGDLRSQQERTCLEGCDAWRAQLANANCDFEFGRYLACVAEGSPACLEQRSAFTRLKVGAVPPGCSAAFDALSSCLAPCQREGVAQLGEGKASGGAAVKFALRHLGCDGCPGGLERAGPAGAPCQAASVCGEVCCRCPDKGWYAAGVCIDGVCGDGERACRAAREAASHDPCR